LRRPHFVLLAVIITNVVLQAWVAVNHGLVPHLEWALFRLLVRFEHFGRSTARPERYDRGVFNFGVGEIAVLVTLAVIFLGVLKLPDLVPLVRPASTPVSSRWSGSDWVLVLAALVAGAVALSLLTVPRR